MNNNAAVVLEGEMKQLDQALEVISAEQQKLDEQQHELNVKRVSTVTLREYVRDLHAKLNPAVVVAAVVETALDKADADFDRETRLAARRERDKKNRDAKKAAAAKGSALQK
jgi:hypothetical protein